MLVRIIIGLFAILVSAGAIAAPCAGFVDVDDSNATYCSAVTYVKNKGITLGCTDASHYCPNADVTRLQMALFLQRAGKGNAVNTLVDSTATIGGGGAGGTQLSLPTAGTYDCTNPPGGPCANRVTDVFGTVAGGVGNQAGDASGAIDSAALATVGGGLANTASGLSSTVAGGSGNTASGISSTVAGGQLNTASGFASTVAGGQRNTASGELSFAAGNRSVADQNQCFAFVNWSSLEGGSCLGTPNIARFILDHGLSVDYGSRRVDGGGTRWVAIGDLFAGTTIRTWTGAFLSDAGVWVDASSSKETKIDFAPVDSRLVLEEVARLPITTWRYKEGEGEVRHMGPMAEDFWAAFGIGYGNKTIADLDARGVALAAIQGLYTELRGRDATISALRSELAELRDRVSQVESLRGELAALRNAIAAAMTGSAVAAMDATAP